jgi:hypothetical protein
MQSLILPSITQVEQFKQLQVRLRDHWQTIDQFDRGECDVVVIPSLSLDQDELQAIRGIHHYEERLLFSLIRLRNPRTRVIYVTSQPIHPSIIEYYLQLLPGLPFSHVRDRLLLFCAHDASPRPLTQKILERPRLMERIRQAMRTERAYITCFNSTVLERELSLQLNIPLLALDPDLLHWGTKSGSRQVFQEAGVPHPDGSPLMQTAQDLAVAAADLWERQPTLQRMVIKLNEGFSGQGNALLSLKPLQQVAPGSASRTARIAALYDAFPNLRFQNDTETWDHFSQKITDLGAIAEAFIEGEVKRSPSVQCRITPLGEVEILSTHDQILGGPDGQTFLGCRFPADDAYRLQLQEYGDRVGQNLAAKGVLERFSVDFIATPLVEAAGQSSAAWDLQAIEINLRKGGTTHPFMALKLLTHGSYDRTTGLYYTQQGHPKYYVATDNLHKDDYRGLLPNDLMDIIADHHLHFNGMTETGSVFHLMGCLSEFGKLGVTSIGNSPEQADEIYNQVSSALDEETISPTTPLQFTSISTVLSQNGHT